MLWNADECLSVADRSTIVTPTPMLVPLLGRPPVRTSQTDYFVEHTALSRSPHMKSRLAVESVQGRRGVAGQGTTTRVPS